MRRGLVLMVVVLLSGLMPGMPVQAQTDERCFAETGFCISGALRSYWERNGGLPVFGFPKSAATPETVEGVALTVQWFERDRLEIQPDGSVTAGRLGAEILELQGTPWQFGGAATPGDGCQVFSETGHQLCGAFRDFWQRQGGLERFGYPISGEFGTVSEGRDLRVQYFERRRFEWHADVNGGSVLLGLLGNEVLAARAGGAQPVTAPAAAVPAEAAPAAAAEPSEPIVVSGYGMQSFDLVVPFDFARLIVDDDSWNRWGLRVTDDRGEVVIALAEPVGRQNSVPISGDGRTFRFDVISLGAWKVTIRPFEIDQSIARGFYGFGRLSSDYWWARAGEMPYLLSYSGTGNGAFVVDLICSRGGAQRLVQRMNPTSVRLEVSVVHQDELCSWDIHGLGGRFVIGPLR